VVLRSSLGDSPNDIYSYLEFEKRGAKQTSQDWEIARRSEKICCLHTQPSDCLSDSTSKSFANILQDSQSRFIYYRLLSQIRVQASGRDRLVPY
jgi:hypothetical protein